MEYLNKKKGFILVSHDRNFLDKVVDHIISINNTNIEIQKGNFSSWYENKQARDTFELTQNEKLEKEISRLEIASKNTANWSNKIEKSKYNTNNSGSSIDRGYVGHRSAKMMKKSKVIEKRIEKSIEEKSGLLHNMDRNDTLKIVPLETKKTPLIVANHLQINYENKAIFKEQSFVIEKGDRVAITGKNGIGKSSLLKLILGNEIPYAGNIKVTADLKISYVSQNTDNLKGNLKEFGAKHEIEESIFKAMLVKMGFSKQDFEKEINQMSEGQNILTRIQIEEAILAYKPTIIFVEHDETFVKKVATKEILIEKNK